MWGSVSALQNEIGISHWPPSRAQAQGNKIRLRLGRKGPRAAQPRGSHAQRMSLPACWPRSFPGLSLHSSWWNDGVWGLGSHWARVMWPHRQSPSPGRQVRHDNTQHWLQPLPCGERDQAGIAVGGRGKGHYWKLPLPPAWCSVQCPPVKRSAHLKSCMASALQIFVDRPVS